MAVFLRPTPASPRITAARTEVLGIEDTIPDDHESPGDSCLWKQPPQQALSWQVHEQGLLMQIITAASANTAIQKRVCSWAENQAVTSATKRDTEGYLGPVAESLTAKVEGRERAHDERSIEAIGEAPIPVPWEGVDQLRQVNVDPG